MSINGLRVFICAATLAASAGFGPPAQAIAYDVDFDPPFIVGFFGGTAMLDVDPSCLDLGAGPHSALNLFFAGCTIDLTSVDITMLGGNPVNLVYTAEQNPIPVLIGVLGNSDNLIGLSTLPIRLEGPNDIEGGRYDECDATLAFTLGRQFVSGPAVFTTCGDNGIQGYSSVATSVTFAQVPEPGTLALLLGGVGAVWTARRRRCKA